MSRRLIGAIVLGVLATLAGMAVSQPLPVPGAPLFGDVDPARTDAALLPPLQVGTLRWGLAELSAVPGALSAPALTFNLFPDVSIVAQGRPQPTERRAVSNTAVWTGRVPGGEPSAVVVASDGVNLDARVVVGGLVYHVQSVGSGLVRISEIDMAAGRHDAQGRPIDDAVPYELTPEDIAHGERMRSAVRADDGTIIDVMVVYTPAAQAFLGSEAAIRLAIEATVALTNLTYQNSGVGFRIRLVHVAPVEYVEQGFSDLSRLSGSSDGHMDIVHQWRDQYKADLVALIAGTPVAERNYCGIANLALGMPAPGSAFSVTEALCISDITFAHELGHNMGKAHDRANGFIAIDPYAYGYQDESEGPGDYGDFVTVMAYSTAGECPPVYVFGVCPAVAYWSDPDATYNGKPLGRPGANGEDNVQSLANTQFPIANYRVSDDAGSTIPTPVPTLTPVPTPDTPPQGYPLNRSFEVDVDANALPDGWAWLGGDGALKCDTGKSPDGTCWVKLKPGAAIRQVVPFDPADFVLGAEATIGVQVRPIGASPGCSWAVLKLIYSDPGAGALGNGKDKLKLALPTAPDRQWTLATGALTIDAAVAAIKLKFKAGTCGGKWGIDAAELTVN
ncbi:MAG: hypothetical protein IPM16_09500 [Chloroflexi bacterium]|nr:hypothetical protein [Chloroflexota bacterium]